MVVDDDVYVWQVKPVCRLTEAIAPLGIDYSNRANLLRAHRSPLNEGVFIPMQGQKIPHGGMAPSR